jgi:hypothetical protein
MEHPQQKNAETHTVSSLRVSVIDPPLAAATTVLSRAKSRLRTAVLLPTSSAISGQTGCRRTSGGGCRLQTVPQIAVFRCCTSTGDEEGSVAMPGKGSRLITVDGIRYRWLIRRRPTYSQAICGAPMTVAVELAEQPASVAVLVLQHAHPATGWQPRPAPSDQSRWPSMFTNRDRRSQATSATAAPSGRGDSDVT